MKKPFISNQEFTLLEIVIIIAIMSLVGLIIYPNYSKIHQIAKTQAAKSVAQSIQMALGSYHLKEGHFPLSNNLTITELVGYLLTDGHLSKFPRNPFTGRPYTDSDPSGEITYHYNPNNNNYVLTLKGPKNLGSLLTLSNVYHISVESNAMKLLYLSVISVVFILLLLIIQFYYHNSKQTKRTRKQVLKHYPLTQREIEIVCQVMKGKTNSQIATVLYIEECTVKKHLKHIFRKLKVTRKTELMAFVLKNEQI